VPVNRDVFAGLVVDGDLNERDEVDIDVSIECKAVYSMGDGKVFVDGDASTDFKGKTNLNPISFVQNKIWTRRSSID